MSLKVLDIMEARVMYLQKRQTRFKLENHVFHFQWSTNHLSDRKRFSRMVRNIDISFRILCELQI